MAFPIVSGRQKVESALEKTSSQDATEVTNKTKLTTDFGCPISNTDNWLKAVGPQRTGPSLLEDQIAREKIHRFDHERIPERVVHARGSGAFGIFTLKESADDVTYAGVLTDTSRKTPLFVRFSTVQGSRGSADTVRDVRGFAVKFYTDEGNWDIVGNNIPVFFIQESVKFPDFVHAVKPEPHNEVPQGQTAHNNLWDFAYLHSEATHMLMWIMSDRAIPRSYRMMQGFGVNTFSLINKEGKRSFVKFHWIPHLGVHSLVWDEALKLGGQDPDFHRKDLMDAIDNGMYPKWDFGIQVIPENKQDDFEFDILDATKIWPEDLVPVRIIGEMELNRNIDEFFPQVEQAAFCTSHIVPGIDFSDDPLLQGRNFSYFDTQISRLGINWEDIPVNRPVCPVMNHNRDGSMRHRIIKGRVNYWPNRFDAGAPQPVEEGGFHTFPEPIQGHKQRTLSAKFREHHRQAQLFYNSLSEHEKFHVQKGFSFELDHCDDPIVYNRMISRLSEIDLELSKNVAKLVGADHTPDKPDPNDGKYVPRVSQLDFVSKEPTVASRRIAIIIGDGYDGFSFEGFRAAVKAAGAIPFVIGLHRQPVFAHGVDSTNPKNGVKPDHFYDGARSTLFDATFIPGGPHVRQLQANGQIKHWITETFGHLKALGATGEAVDLVESALSGAGEKLQFASSMQAVESYGVITVSRNPTSEHFPKDIVKGFKLVKGAGDFMGKFLWEVSQHRNYKREMDGLTTSVAF